MSAQDGSPSDVASSPTDDAARQPSIGLPSAQIREEAPKVGDGTPWSLWVWIRRMRSAALFAAALACGATACAGVALLLFLFVARTFAPATASVVRPLYFDYTQQEAVASVSLLNGQRSTFYAHSLNEVNRKNQSVPHSKERFLAPGEQITAWVTVQLPDSVDYDIFQAVGELQAADGRRAARSSRPVLPQRRPLALSLARTFTTAPLAAVGLWHDYVRMQVTLFERYREREDTPFAVFACKLRGRAGSGLPPPVAHAQLHVRMHLGPLRRLLYWLRPSFWVTIWLAMAGLTAALGGACFSALFAALWLISISSGGAASQHSRPVGAPPDDDALSTESSADGVFEGELSPELEEESPLAGDPLEEEETDLDFSIISPREAAAKHFTSPRQRSSPDSAGPLAGSLEASPTRQHRGIGRLFGLSSPARRR